MFKTLINQAHTYFFPPNLEDFRGEDEAEASIDGGAGEKVKKKLLPKVFQKQEEQWKILQSLQLPAKIVCNKCRGQKKRPRRACHLRQEQSLKTSCDSTYRSFCTLERKRKISITKICNYSLLCKSIYLLESL